MSNNVAVITRGVQKYVDGFVTNHLLAVGDRVAHHVINWLNAGGMIPVDTHNLADSAGVGVYLNGILQKYIPRRGATEPRVLDREYWGYQELEKALDAGISRFSKGLWIVLFVGNMPYAIEVDEKYNFAEPFRQDMFSAVYDELNPLF